MNIYFLSVITFFQFDDDCSSRSDRTAASNIEVTHGNSRNHVASAGLLTSFAQLVANLSVLPVPLSAARPSDLPANTGLSTTRTLENWTDTLASGPKTQTLDKTALFRSLMNSLDTC